MTSQQNNTNIMHIAAIISTILFILLAAIPTAHAVDSPNLIISKFEILEGQAQVGKDFTLVLHLQNVQPAPCAMGITTNVQANAPFTLKGVSTVPVEQMCDGQEKIVRIPMHIDSNANGGTYPITITNNYQTTLLTQFSNTNIINLQISGSPELTARIISSNPVDVYAGNSASITLQVENTGSYAAQTTTLTLSAPSPIEIKWASTSTSLGTLNAKESKNAQFNLEVPKDAAAKDYDLVLTATYLDENLNAQKRTIPLVLHVTKKAQFTTIDAGSDSLFAAENMRTIRFKITNTGTDTARKMRIKMLPQYPFSTDGSVRYVETLATGESKPIEFTTTIDKDGTAGTYGLDLLVDYEDAQGKKLQDTTKISLTIEHKSILRAVFLDYWFLWLIVVAIIVIRLVKRVKGTAAKEKSEKNKK